MHIELRELTKSYQRTKALAGVNLEIAPGQIVAVLGANGAGKTTLLRCLSSLLGPDRGAILYDGQPFYRGNIEMRRRVFFLPDFPVMFDGWPVLRHVSMVARLYRKEEQPGLEERVEGLLDDLDLLPLAERPLAELSRGQRYKAALTALLAVDPEVWLLDEPFASGMDPNGIQVLRRHAREAAARGRTIIYSTQILEVAEKFSDRVCVLHRGELRSYDTVANLKAAQVQGDAGPLYALFQQLRAEDKE